MVGNSRLDVVIELAKRRGFFFPSAEIYPGTAAGTWEYGPLGLTIKRKLKGIWRTFFINQDRMLEISGSSILPEPVFIASGHIKSFVDPLTQCKTCKTVYRADKLLAGKTQLPILEGTSLDQIDAELKKHNIHCPRCGGQLLDSRHFNLMFQLHVGATSGNIAYLRPETCQNIFINFNRIFRTMRKKLPFGIAQIGDSYRNEISPRRGLIRMRQFTQAEAEVFFNPAKINAFPPVKTVYSYRLRLLLQGQETVQDITVKDAVDKKIVEGQVIGYYLARLQQFLDYLQIPREVYRYRELGENERPFYALQAFDLELKTSWGWQEIAGNHYRTDHDLSEHMKLSKKDLTIMDDDKKILPHVWEFSLGIDRLLLVLMDIWHRSDDQRTWLQIPPVYAPADVAVFPLVKKDAQLVKIAKSLEQRLRGKGLITIYDEKSTIGRRYARVDEIGCPFALTIDQDSISKKTLTIRNRDTKEQLYVPLDKVYQWLAPRIKPLPPGTVSPPQQ
ncbi:MAG: glycine--tRNA ligase [Candidatus Ranarchaeia archaeon]